MQARRVHARRRKPCSVCRTRRCRHCKPRCAAPDGFSSGIKPKSALSTTNQDVGLRRRLYQRLPPAAARKILARAFPGGTAVPAIEMRRAEQGAREDENILDSIADELIAQYRHPMERACAA